jgi:hypothetical protein
VKVGGRGENPLFSLPSGEGRGGVGRESGLRAGAIMRNVSQAARPFALRANTPPLIPPLRGGKSRSWATERLDETERGAARPHTPVSAFRSIGSERTRLPVAAKTAFDIAGASVGTPGSPMPVGSASDATICTSTRGISLNRVG